MSEIVTGTNILWTLVAAALVFSMQAGFVMVETGFTRAKNAGNIIMKNLMDFAFGTVVFWILGFGLMYGGDGLFIGKLDLFSGAAFASGEYDYTTLLFQTVFCATAATIVAGAMAERTKFIAYIIYSIIISLVIYPVSGHWVWGGGFLAQMGFHDFAGSTVVHTVGGVASLIGAAFLGPRIGKYGKDKKPKAIPGHSLTLGALGVFILWFGWFGFNGGSTVSILELSPDGSILSALPAMLASKVIVNTNMAAATGTIATMIFTWIRYKKPDVSMTLNGSLAGLVAITAGCDIVNPWSAAIIGFIAGIVIVLAVEFFDKVARIDDPVGAISVHGICGILGTILAGVFVSRADLADMGMSRMNFLGVQVFGVLVVAAWIAVTMTIVFAILKKTVGIRVSTEEEVLGLDLTEHGLASAYADFNFATGTVIENTAAGMAKNINHYIAESSLSEKKEVPVIHKERILPDSEHKFTKLDIVCKPEKLDALKVAMNDIGITGMTVSNVIGFGMQKGNVAHYRGIEVDVIFRSKIKLEIVVCKVPVEKVVETAKAVLYTGNVGDGKIFVYDVENVIKVRTGEEGFDALQDD